MGTALVTLLNVIGSILKIRGHDDLGQYARLAAGLIQEGAKATGEFEKLSAELQAMVDEDRDPTQDEVAAVTNRRRELSRLMAEALAAGSTEDDEPDPEDQPPAPEVTDAPAATPSDDTADDDEPEGGSGDPEDR